LYDISTTHPLIFAHFGWRMRKFRRRRGCLVTRQVVLMFLLEDAKGKDALGWQ